MFIEVNSQEQLSQVRTCLMAPNTRQDLKQKNCLSLICLERRKEVSSEISICLQINFPSMFSLKRKMI